MVINNFNKLVTTAKKNTPIKLAIAMPHNEHVLGSLALAAKEGLIIPHIAGNKQIIESLAKEHHIDLGVFNVTYAEDKEAINYAIDLVKNGTCSILMKGDQSTASIMSPVLKKENNLRTGSVISHNYILELPSYHKLLIITDGALNIAPKLDEQIGILENAIKLSNTLGTNTPKVAVLSAVEVPTAKMPSTLDAEVIANNLNLKQQAIIEGPLAFDAAINSEAALIKHMQSEVAGDIDIALVPFIEAGNMLAKSLIYLGGAKAAGIILGAKVPIILTSRSDSLETKFLSIALASLYANGGKNA